jgi:hypothetical protein
MTAARFGKYSATQHVVAFIDALGFSTKIKTSPETVDLYLHNIDHVREVWGKKHPHFTKLIKMTTIGDSLILAIELLPIDNSEFQNALRKRLAILGDLVAGIQGALAMQNIWVRGAITFGELVFDESNRIVGPAFHRAYHLEKTVARVPRIILDGLVVGASGFDSVTDLIRSIEIKDLFYDSRASRPSEVELLKDVPTFIDFAARSDSITDRFAWIRQVSINVSRRLREDVEHYSKYRWVADYLLNYLLIDPTLKIIAGDDIAEIRHLLRQS